MQFAVQVPEMAERTTADELSVLRVRHVLSGYDLELYSAVDALEQIRNALSRDSLT
jgi:hypothetical protein